MKWLKILKVAIIDTEIYVSLIGALLATFFMLEQNTFRFSSFFIIFFSYLGGYIYTRYHSILPKRYTFSILLLLGVICMLIVWQYHAMNQIIICSGITLLGFLYNSVFLKYVIRTIPYIKTFYVAFIWALIISLLAIPDFEWGVFFIVFLYISALILPFDIRDMKIDTIPTIPNQFGVKITKILALLLLLAATILSYYTMESRFFISISFSCIAAGVLVLFTNENRKPLYFSFGLESAVAFPFLFLILITYF